MNRQMPGHVQASVGMAMNDYRLFVLLNNLVLEHSLGILVPPTSEVGR